MVSAIPITRTRLSHALTIRANGRIIGAIHQWSPSQSREVDTEFEVGPNEVGMPRDLVPQTVSTRTIRISRYDLYTTAMEEAFGSTEIINLVDQFRPFTLREVWAAPGGLNSLLAATGFNLNLGALQTGLLPSASVSLPQTPGAAAALVFSSLTAGTSPRQYEFGGCWFTNIGRTIDAKSDRVVSVEAEVTYLTKRRIF